MKVNKGRGRTEMVNCPKCNKPMIRKPRDNDWWCKHCAQWLNFLRRHGYKDHEDAVKRLKREHLVDPSLVIVNGEEAHRHFPAEDF